LHDKNKSKQDKRKLEDTTSFPEEEGKGEEVKGAKLAEG
jgi:hypothetical protein